MISRGHIRYIPTPSLNRISCHITSYELPNDNMSRRGSLLTQVQTKSARTSQTKKSNSLSIDQEIECPSCHDIMALCSDFDSFCYLCRECSFILYFE